MDSILRWWTLILTILLSLTAARPLLAAAAGDLADRVGPGNDWEIAVDGLGFADGLSYDADGNVFFADLRGPGAGVYKLAPDGTKTKLTSGGRSGTRLGHDGRLYACGGSTLVAIDLADGKVTTVAENLGTNDLAVSKTGHVYITDTGKKQVTLVDPKAGKAGAADTGITAPNGIGLSPDHKTLYVSDYNGINVWSFTVNADGSLSDKKPVMTMKAPENKPTVAGGDGMTVDSDGRCYVTTALGLQVFAPDGKLLGVLPKPGNGPLVSAGFGGKDLSLLYVANGDKIYRRKTMVHGALPAPVGAARPKVAKPEVKEDAKSTPPPPGAILLFDGTEKTLKANWQRQEGGEPTWEIKDGGATARGGSIVTKEKFNEPLLVHVEFRTPYEAAKKPGHLYGNSGVYLQGRYEVQILDSYGVPIEKYALADCGSIYDVALPKQNACKPPTVWQSFDIEFHPPKFDAMGKKTEPARMTVFQNGVKLHDNQPVPLDNTTAGMGGDPKTPGPIMLQDHGDPVEFRNVWVGKVGSRQ